MTHLARYGIVTAAVLLVSALPLAASGAEEEGAMGAQANMALTKVEGEPYVDHIHATPEAYAAATGNTIDQFFEAPMLAALVAEGKLPPVEERIGQDPQVVRPRVRNRSIRRSAAGCRSRIRVRPDHRRVAAADGEVAAGRVGLLSERPEVMGAVSRREGCSPCT